MILAESITHLEDLDIKDFIKAVRNIATMQATEKLDGANLWTGLDASGKLFTTRAGKREGSEKFYAEADYPYFAAYNGFRATHAALQQKEAAIKDILSPGEIVEIEVLYGRQPNAVTYGQGGKNFIAFLRGVEGTPDSKVDQLVGKLNNDEVTVHTAVVDTSDGITLDQTEIDQTFKFVGVQKIHADTLKSIDITAAIKELEDYLAAPSDVNGLTNFELMTTSLGSIPKEGRALAKAAKDEVLAAVKTKFKVQIKKELLDKFVSKIKPALAADNLSNDEDNGIEGVVLRDPLTGDQIKIVDKDGFTTINQFNFAVRNQITGMVRTTDSSASLESRGGIIGSMKIRIAELFGNKDLAIGRGAKKIFADNKGETAAETLANVAKVLNGNDYLAIKTKTEAIVEATRQQLVELLETFNKTKGDTATYKLKLKNGKSIGLSPEIIKRTLMTFAETRRNLDELLAKTKGAGSFEELIGVMYGRVARAAHSAEDEEISENFAHEIPEFLIEKRNYTDQARYKAVSDGFTLLNIYLVTVLMSVLIYKTNDRLGIKLLKDKPHYRLTKWEPEMSPLNFWGYVVWRASTPTVKSLIGKKTAADIFRHARKVPPNWVKFLHMDLSFGKDVDIDWEDHYKTLKVLMQFPSISTDRLNLLLDGVFKYDTLTYDEKVKLLPKLYFFANQFVPTSPLLPRVRVIQDNLLLNATGENDEMVVESLLKLIIAESDEEGGAQVPPLITPKEQATTTADVSTKEGTIKRGAVIVKRKRNPSVKHKRFERPKE